MWTAGLFMASRLAASWCRKLGIADHSRAIAPAICGVAMDVPLKFAYELSLSLVDERVPVPGAEISGFMRPLPSVMTGPRLLKEAMVSEPVFNAPDVYVAS
jgi:hypothetical protein